MSFQDEIDFKKLIDKGYMIESNVDEKKLRNYRYMKHLTDNRLNLVVHLTKACNFRCSYCYMDFEPVMLKEDVQEGIINYITKSIQKYKSVRISWFGGEPLLGIDIIEKMSKSIIEICRIQKKPYSAIITTNGYNLTPENIKKLISCKVNHIAVTIDGTEELHDSQRTLADGSPTFNTIIKNLIYIRDHIKSRTLTISIRSNITTKHASDLDSYYHFFNKEFGKDHRFSLFIRPVADYGGSRVKSMENYFIQDMHSIYDYLFKIQQDIKFFPNFIDLEMGGYTCTARSMYKFTIGCEGEISKCDESLKDKIGVLKRNGTMELDETKNAEWVLACPKKECENCFFSGSCFMELCPKARVINKNNQCSVNFKEIDSLIWLAANTYDTPII